MPVRSGAGVLLLVAWLGVPRQARPQTPEWRPHLSAGFGAGLYAGTRSQPDSQFATLLGAGLHAVLSLSLQSPAHLYSAQLDASVDRYIPLYLCWDGCPSSGIPTAVAGLRIGARWHWPDIFPHAFVSGGLGVYAPIGRSPYWQGATPGIDIGMGYLSARDRTLVIEHRLIWLPGSPSAPVLLQMTFLKSL